MGDTKDTAVTENGRISVILPPPAVNSFMPLPAKDATIALPIELIEALNQAYLLHALATDPSKVLPPGKSLLSVLSRPHSKTRKEGDAQTLQNKVEDMVHKNFWNEVVESLAKPEPSIQLPRLKLLYKDLETALRPLLPPGHPVLVTLSSQLSPTISPLHSAVTRLREILASLRIRCAPARDVDIDKLLEQLETPPPLTSPLATSLAGLIAGTIKSTLDLAATMQDDLSQFVLGNMEEKQLGLVMAQQARREERNVVLGVWQAKDVQKNWFSWVEGISDNADPRLPTLVYERSDSVRQKWRLRLLQALGSTSAVVCTLPIKGILNNESTAPSEDLSDSPQQNTLPPPFLFSTPSLLYLQNFLQALVIAACLRSLVKFAPLSDKPSSRNPSNDFLKRIWTLLTTEIIEDPASGESTKLINLADETVQARNIALQSSASAFTPDGPKANLDPLEEKTLRAAVERTLQTSDPVFKLLQKRLLFALAERLVHDPADDEKGSSSSIPERMQSGVGERNGKRPRLMLGTGDVRPGRPVDEKVMLVEGFRDSILLEGVGDALKRLRSSVDWIETTWGDLMDTDSE